MALAVRLRAVVEHVPQEGTAARAADLRAQRAAAVVGVLGHVVGVVLFVEARPAGAGIELGIGPIQLQLTSTPDTITLEVSAVLKRTGTAVRLIVSSSDREAKPDPSLVRLLARAFGIRDRLDSNPDLSMQKIAEAEGIVASYATRLLRLSYLAPDIVAAILQGHQPPELTAIQQRTR